MKASTFRHVHHPALSLLFMGLLLLTLSQPVRADEGQQAILHMLDYIGVDYPETVKQGRVLDSAEFAEQQEFAQRVLELIGQLPDNPARRSLIIQAHELKANIDTYADGANIAALTQSMRQQLTRAYQVVTTPRTVPDLQTAARLYQANCASCHGAQGQGDGPLAAGLDPAPTNFHLHERATQRSLYGLFSTISLGVEGTGMRSFGELSAEQRWALAFYVSGFAASEAQRERGATLWTDIRNKTPLANMEVLTRITPAEAHTRYGQDGADILAYLRGQPDALQSASASPLQTSQTRLAESLAQYRTGDPKQAYALALSAYLDGFELAESGLRAVDPALVTQIEQAMLAYRQQIREGAGVTQVATSATTIQALLSQAQTSLEQTRLSPSMGFVSAFVILLREGLEALLLLAAIYGILIKTGRRDALPYFHAGWAGALLLGVATWAASAYVVDISGASRELTEGFTALLAAAVLLYVGFWLHGKSHAHRWREFVHEKIQNALQGRALWALTAIAFLAVYREVFETILFYQALWLQSENRGTSALWSGILLAALALGVLGWIIMRSSMRLPLRLFFNVNAIIMFVLAVVFVGHGIAALQEAGRLPADPVSFPRITLLGIYPTFETLMTQLLVLVVVVGAMLYERSRRQHGAH